MHWITVGPPDQPGTSIVLPPPTATPGITDDERRTIAEMMAKGSYASINLATADLDRTFERLQAGAEVVQEPTEQPYGVRDSAVRDPAGNLIRVHGARVNNLKDLSVELPKRRLTAFTGVSGSGKSSLVFSTIAAESQRLINETYSAFLQGFMPSLARPEVDLLDGLTTAIIVDQERMGANPRSTVGTATDANAMLRILFSRLGQPHIGPPVAYSFNIPTRRAPKQKPIAKFTKKELQDLLYNEPTKIKVEGINLPYAGLIPRIQKSMLA